MSDDLAERILSELASIKKMLAERPPMEDRSLTSAAAALYLGVHHKTVDKLRKAGHLQGYRTGPSGHWHYRTRLADLLEDLGELKSDDAGELRAELARLQIPPEVQEEAVRALRCVVDGYVTDIDSGTTWGDTELVEWASQRLASVRAALAWFEGVEG